MSKTRQFNVENRDGTVYFTWSGRPVVVKINGVSKSEFPESTLVPYDGSGNALSLKEILENINNYAIRVAAVYRTVSYRSVN